MPNASKNSVSPLAKAFLDDVQQPERLIAFDKESMLHVRRKLDMNGLNGEPGGIPRLVLREGLFFRHMLSKPNSVNWGVPKLCFENAMKLHVVEDLAYCEGFALTSCGLTLHHAWCLDDRGRVIDNTWREPGHAYFGVPFDPNWIQANLRKFKWTSLLENFQRGCFKHSEWGVDETLRNAKATWFKGVDL